MFKITVDGCDYAVNEDHSTRFGPVDYISVASHATGLVGVAQISHDQEDIQVSYQVDHSDDTIGDESASYNYYEYLADPDAKRNLAAWIVATHPAN